MSRRISQLLSACLGNFFEHYDTALFGFLSPFLAPLIFPEHDQITALILTYAMISLGMLARPLGALVFGYIGDVYGRRQALFLSLVGMSIVSGCIAFSPLYQQAGIIAPILFGVGRLLQNFLSSGETMGGAIFLLESSSEKKHDILSSIYGASTIGGILFASAAVSVISHFQWMEYGWRVLYLIGCVTTFFGFIIRKKLPSNSWDGPEQLQTFSMQTLFNAYRNYFKVMLLIAVTAGFSYANYVVALVLMNGFVPLITNFTKVQMMSLNTGLLVLDFCALPFFGWVAAKTSRETLMLGALLGVVLFAIPLFAFLPEATIWGIIFIRICFVIFGVAFFAPYYAWAQQLVPPTYRYAIISCGYAIGTQLFGGPTAALSLWAFKKTGLVMSVAWYWMALAIFSCIAMVFSMRKQESISTIN